MKNKKRNEGMKEGEWLRVREGWMDGWMDDKKNTCHDVTKHNGNKQSAQQWMQPQGKGDNLKNEERNK